MKQCRFLTLYRYKRENGGVSVSTEKPEGAYTETKRLVADEGMILTDGNTYTPCIDIEDESGWEEIEMPLEMLMYAQMGEYAEKAQAYDILTGEAE